MIPNEKTTSLFDDLFAQTAPPDEPYLVPIGGVAFEFKPVLNRGEWDDLIEFSRSRAKNILADPDPAVKQFAHMGIEHRAKAFALARLMTGAYRKIGQDGKGEGEKDAPFTPAEWLKMCEMRPAVFDQIFEAVSAVQGGSMAQAEAEEIDRLGKSSEETLPGETD